MKERTFYKLRVHQPIAFSKILLDILPTGTLISFEGKLSKVLIPKFLHSDKASGLLVRNTKSPKQDLWIFQLDHETKNYLKSEFLDRIGLRTNVLHILAEVHSNIIFASYDGFSDGSVLIWETIEITKESILQLADGTNVNII